MSTIPQHTAEHLRVARDAMVRMIYKLHIAKKTEPLSEVITCDRCPKKASCVSVFDIYNTDGDCLEDK
jgi:hypothetical protein